MVNESDVMRRKARALGKTVPPWQDDLKNLEHFHCALYGDKESLTLYRQRFSLRKTHFLPLKQFLKCYGAKCH